ncbi:MAG: hypothetical protein JST55_15820 [Bacteroidetes bacterium]|nr:hypothetical protein [Bacteroidota bacterium]
MNNSKSTNLYQIAFYDAGEIVPERGIYKNLLDSKKGLLLEKGNLFPGLNKKKASKWMLVLIIPQ